MVSMSEPAARPATAGTLSSSGRILSTQLDMQVSVFRELALSSPRNLANSAHEHRAEDETLSSAPSRPSSSPEAIPRQ
jgi:hypothetical protein